jgi:serine/threonine protein kinase
MPSVAPPSHLVLGDIVGDGSFSTVRKARLGDDAVAVKVMKKETMLRARKPEQAWIEHRILSSTSHPSIVRHVHTFQDIHCIYFVQELVEGGDLEAQIGDGMPVDRVRHYALLVLEVLEHLASRRIAWRDCKPENVLLDGRGSIRCCDFGTAKSPPQGPTPRLAREHTHTLARLTLEPLAVDREANCEHRLPECVGTPQYMSPEAVVSRPPTDARSDLWSMGAVIYRMLSGAHAFDAGSAFLVMEAVRHRTLAPFPEDFPPHATDLINRLLTMKMGSRPTHKAVRAHAFFTASHQPSTSTPSST